VLLALTFALLVGGCDQDPFGRTERTIVGSYSLDRWEGGLFYIDDKDSPHSGEGVVGAPVKRLGWNDHYIVAERAGVPPETGWMVIDVTRRQVTGPEAFHALRQRRELAGLATLRADSAWDELE
jgi:hypothetical protein